MHLSQSRPILKRPYEDYYRSHFVASVRFDDGDMIVEGGKRDLTRAKARTEVCYVKDIETLESIKLVLVDQQWVQA